jgi:hypothetical protein
VLETQSQRLLALALILGSPVGYMTLTSLDPKTYNRQSEIGFIVTGGRDANEVMSNDVMSKDAWAKAQDKCAHFDGLDPVSITGSPEPFDHVMKRIGFNAKLVCETHSDRTHNILMRLLASLVGPVILLVGVGALQWIKRGERS